MQLFAHFTETQHTIYTVETTFLKFCEVSEDWFLNP